MRVRIAGSSKGVLREPLRLTDLPALPALPAFLSWRFSAQSRSASSLLSSQRRHRCAEGCAYSSDTG